MDFYLSFFGAKQLLFLDHTIDFKLNEANRRQTAAQHIEMKINIQFIQFIPTAIQP